MAVAENGVAQTEQRVEGQPGAEITFEGDAATEREQRREDAELDAGMAHQRTQGIDQNRTVRSSVTAGLTPALSAILKATLSAPQVAE